MKLIALINKDMPLGQVLNGLGHMSFGLGHLIKGEPDVNVFFGSSEQVREFRNLASFLQRASPDTALFSDFANTMVGHDSAKLIADAAQKSEADWTFFGAIYAAADINPSLSEVLKACSQLTGYAPHTSKDAVSLLPAQTQIAGPVADMKINMLLNTKQPLASTVNAAILACLAVGNKPEYAALSFMNFRGKEDVLHDNISFHPFPILMSRSPAEHDGMAAVAEKTPAVFSQTRRDDAKQPLVTVLFGLRTEVEEIALRKLTRLFDKNLKPNELAACGPTSWFVAKSSANLLFSPQSKMPLPASTEDLVAKAVDRVSAAALLELPSLVEALKTELAAFADKKQDLADIVGAALSAAAGAGKFANVQYILATYKENISVEDLDHCQQYAAINKHEQTAKYLAGALKEAKATTDAKLLM